MNSDWSINITHLSTKSYNSLLITVILIFILCATIMFIEKSKHAWIRWIRIFILAAIVVSGVMTGRNLKADSDHDKSQIVKQRNANVTSLNHAENDLITNQKLASYWGIKANDALTDKKIKMALTQQTKANQKVNNLKNKINNLKAAINKVQSNGDPK